MYNYQNSKSKKRNNTIDLLEIVYMLFNHFKMIVIFVLVFTALGLGVAFMQPEKHNINAVIELKAPTETDIASLSKYGIDYYSAYSVFSRMFSRESFEAVVPENNTLTYDKIFGDSPVITYSRVENTNYYKITAKKISEKDVDFYTELISSLVENAKKEIVSTYKESAEKGLERCNSNINELAGSSSTAGYSSELSLYLTARTGIENFLSMIPNALTWFEAPTVDEKNVGTSKVELGAIFFLIGGVIGALTAVIIDFSDNRIYSSDKLIEFLGDDLVASVPLYKDKDRISNMEYEYISSKLDGTKNILVTSLSPRAGKTTIASGLESVMKGSSVTDGDSITRMPEILKSAKDNDLVLVVLRAGVDTYVKMDKLISDFKVQGIKYAFVFNSVERSDKDVNIYSSLNDYEKHIWLKESWREFYKARYR